MARYLVIRPAHNLVPTLEKRAGLRPQRLGRLDRWRFSPSVQHCLPSSSGSERFGYRSRQKTASMWRRPRGAGAAARWGEGPRSNPSQEAIIFDDAVALRRQNPDPTELATTEIYIHRIKT